MTSKMRCLRPLLPAGWLLPGSGALLLRPSTITLLIVVLQATALLVAVWVPAWRQARGQDRAQKLVEAMGVPPASVVVGADGRIEIRYAQDSGDRRSGKRRRSKKKG
jgi:hypothetical protein